MRKLCYVIGELTEVQRYINVPMRWLPLLALGRFLMRGRLRMRVASWLATVDVPAVGRAMPRRVK